MNHTRPLRPLRPLLPLLPLLLLPATTTASPPDLCAEPQLTVDGAVDQDSTGFTLSRWCPPHPAPPIWAEELCCTVDDSPHCTPPSTRGTCPTGMKFWCEHGEQLEDGQVACYQTGPSACESGFCVEDLEPPEGPEVFVATIWLCCYEANEHITCIHHSVTPTGDMPAGDCDGGFFAMCNWGATNIDGTVDCYG